MQQQHQPWRAPPPASHAGAAGVVFVPAVASPHGYLDMSAAHLEREDARLNTHFDRLHPSAHAAESRRLMPWMDGLTIALAAHSDPHSAAVLHSVAGMHHRYGDGPPPGDLESYVGGGRFGGRAGRAAG